MTDTLAILGGTPLRTKPFIVELMIDEAPGDLWASLDVPAVVAWALPDLRSAAPNSCRGQALILNLPSSSAFAHTKLANLDFTAGC
jgi:hypothetical protein